MVINESKTTGDVFEDTEYNTIAATVNDITDNGLPQKLTFSGTDHEGIVPINLTTTQRDALTPDTGAVIWNSTTTQLEYYNGSTWEAVDTDTGLLNVVEDTTPQLGGDLDAQSNDITSVARFDYDYAEGTVSALGNLGATETIDWSTASHFEGTLDDNVTITHSNEVSGQKITLALAYDGSAQRTITWSDVDKWEGGTAPDAPSASGEVLVVTLIFLGTTCYATGGIFS